MKGILFLVLFGLYTQQLGAEEVAVSVCNLEPETGMCRAYLNRFFYNSTISGCEVFVFGGCGGNGNNFDSKEKCESSCREPEIPPPPADSEEETNEDDQKVEDIKTPFNLIGKLFQKHLKPFEHFNAFKSDSLFKAFRPDFTGLRGTDFDDMTDEDDNNDDEEEGEENKEEEKWGKLLPDMINLPNLMKISRKVPSKLRTNIGDLFGDFDSEWFNTDFKTLTEKLNASFEKVSKEFNKSLSTITFGGIHTQNSLTCTVCKGFVNIVKFEIYVANMSIAYILKNVDKICAFFPFAEAQCKLAVASIREIIKLIIEGLSPGGICEKIHLCSNETLPSGMIETASITFSRTCPALCNFMKVVQEEKLLKLVQSWKGTETKLKNFCKLNKIISKCNIFFKLLGKSTRHLSSIFANKTDDNCNCFKRQPIFDTKKFDSCHRCKQFEKGITNELNYANDSINSLASRIEKLCLVFPKAECSTIVSEIRTSTTHLEGNVVSQGDLCYVTGYCEKKENKPDVGDRIKETFNRMKEIFKGPSLMSRSMELSLKRFSSECLFCKKCMSNLQETFKNINQTDAKNTFPAIKEGISIFCHTKSNGKYVTKVCKKISDGIETVYKVISKRNNDEGMCKILGVC